MKLLALSLIGLFTLAAQAAAPFNATFHHAKWIDVRDHHKEFTSRGLGPQTLNFYFARDFIRAAGAFDAGAISDVRVHFGIDQREFDRRFRINTRDGYRPKELSVVSQYGVATFFVTWEKNVSNRPSAVWIHLTDREFDQKWNELVKQKGFRLTRHVAYSLGRERRHAAIFVKDGQGFVFYWNMSRDTLRSRTAELAGQGMFLSDISTHEVGASTAFSAIWTREYSQPKAQIDMNGATFQSTYENYRLNGYSLKKVIGYNLGRSFAAIWAR